MSIFIAGIMFIFSGVSLVTYSYIIKPCHITADTVYVGRINGPLVGGKINDQVE